MSCKCKIGLLYIIGENMIAMYMSFIDSEDDREKFEIIYHEYRKRMFSVAYSILHNNEDAEDAVHETRGLKRHRRMLLRQPKIMQ